MFSLRSLSVALVACGILSSGCIAEPVDSAEMPNEVGEAEQPIIEFANGVFTDYFWNGDVQTELKFLGTKALRDPSTAFAQASPLHSNALGRIVFGHMVSCALTPGTELQAKVNGITYSYYGKAGLAKQWEGVPLDNPVWQRWVTSCMLQSLNAFGTPVSLAISGDHESLETDPNGEDLSEYVYADVITFGNLFLVGAAPKAYVCYLEQMENACGVATSSYADLRVCGSSANCGMTNLGKCADVCETDEKGNSKCEAPGGNTYIEAIMSRLQKDGFHTLYPDCAL